MTTTDAGLTSLVTQLGRARASAMDVPAVLGSICSAIPGVLGVGGAVLLLVNPPDGVPAITASDARALWLAETQQRTDMGPLPGALRTWRPMLTTDLTRIGPPAVAAAAVECGLGLLARPAVRRRRRPGGRAAGAGGGAAARRGRARRGAAPAARRPRRPARRRPRAPEGRLHRSAASAASRGGVVADTPGERRIGAGAPADAPGPAGRSSRPPAPPTPRHPPAGSGPRCRPPRTNRRTSRWPRPGATGRSSPLRAGASTRNPGPQAPTRRARRPRGRQPLRVDHQCAADGVPAVDSGAARRSRSSSGRHSA